MTEIGEILPLWHNLKNLWPVFDCFFNFSIIFVPTLANVLKLLGGFSLFYMWPNIENQGS